MERRIVIGVLHSAQTQYDEVLAALDLAGVGRVPSANPYWERAGITVLDPDGRRVVIFNGQGL